MKEANHKQNNNNKNNSSHVIDTSKDSDSIKTERVIPIPTSPEPLVEVAENPSTPIPSNNTEE